MFVHETLLSLLAPSRQQRCSPFEELRRVVRDNEMVSQSHAVPAVAPSGRAHTPNSFSLLTRLSPGRLPEIRID